MANCTYHLINDFYNQNHDDMALLAEKIEGIELTLDVDSLDVDLDNLEQQLIKVEEQLIINNKIKLLEAVGTDIMPEEEQISAYEDLVNEVFRSSIGPIGGTPIMEEEEGEF